MPAVIAKEIAVIDYPEADEKIASQHYTIRVGVHGDAQKVEVSVDDGEWQPCRPAVGFWWYDWSRFQAGRHHVIGRVHLRDGHTFTTAPRPFRVELRQTGPSRTDSPKGTEALTKRK